MPSGLSSSIPASKVDELVDRACERSGLTDLGPDSWREGLSILVDTLESANGVVPEGRDDLYRQFVDALWNRSCVVDFIKRHPEVTQERVERPLVILGLPRTGTTVASCLLDQDPARRSLLNWEAGNSVPPATTKTLRTDPRCLKRKAELDQLAAALEAAKFPIPHWEDADGPTECTFVLNQDFKAFLWEAFMPTPAYAEWLLETDVSSAYVYERSVLQVLQSRAPGTWSLKMPSHGVNIEALIATFPDVRIVWSHRDPFKATASMLSMNQLARGMTLGSALNMAEVVPNVLRQMRAHVDRPMRVRSRLGNQRFFDLHYADLMRDPIGQMRALYEWAGDELTPSVEEAMLGWLERNPQDRFGVRPYSLDAYGITKTDLEPIFEEYLSVFDIELEGV
jgi:hypothetical protein